MLKLQVAILSLCLVFLGCGVVFPVPSWPLENGRYLLTLSTGETEYVDVTPWEDGKGQFIVFHPRSSGWMFGDYFQGNNFYVGNTHVGEVNCNGCVCPEEGYIYEGQADSDTTFSGNKYWLNHCRSYHAQYFTAELISE